MLYVYYVWLDLRAFWPKCLFMHQGLHNLSCSNVYTSERYYLLHWLTLQNAAENDDLQSGNDSEDEDADGDEDDEVPSIRCLITCVTLSMLQSSLLPNNVGL